VAVPARRLPQSPTVRRATRPPGVVPAPTRPRPVPAAARRRRLPFFLLSMVLVTVVVVGVVSAQTLVAQGSFRLQELKQEADRLEDEFGRLRLRVDTLSTLERIERTAKKAGLVYPVEGYRVLKLPRDDAPMDAAGGSAPGVEGAADVKAALGAGG
jgi:cell division protein FtsL